MNVILFDSNYRSHLLPLTFTRAVADIRIGILTIREKWNLVLNCESAVLTEPYLQVKYKALPTNKSLFVNASFCPSKGLVELLLGLKSNEVVVYGEDVVAYWSENASVVTDFSTYKNIQFTDTLLSVKYPWDIFSKNKIAIEHDFDLLTKNRTSEPISSTNNVICPERVFIEQGAKLEYTTLNASTGPIYIGKHAEIMEGSVVRGALALCDNATLKLATKIYGATTVGPYCKVGGEVNNSVLFGYSNKGHDGFLGNAVLGEWCNLGADTNNSNLKNNYAEVRLWDYGQERFAKTGLQFCGLIMGDHSKCAINTMFNTGTVVGVFANIFGSGFPRNFVPSFTWGGPAGVSTYLTKKAFEVAEIVMQRRGIEFSNHDKMILEHVFETTKKWRKTES